MQRAILQLTLGLPLLLSLAACGSGPRPPAKQADGSYDLSCRGRLSSCLRQAERVCGDQGYWVATAHDIRELLGHKAGQSQIGVERSDATVVCGTAPKEDPIRLQREVQKETELPAAEPAAAPVGPRRACVPGSTQACVGPAGCSGGQVCSTDGAHYEPCDCGAPAAAPPAP
ncbi:MAG: hypothetical protein EOO73_25065 [Myxococcales bacterium]|nr:MAG: hypothetical protein EOO73_25065 [Myxococcales bacterium]